MFGEHGLLISTAGPTKNYIQPSITGFWLSCQHRLLCCNVLTITSNQQQRGRIFVAVRRKTVVKDVCHGLGRIFRLFP